MRAWGARGSGIVLSVLHRLYCMDVCVCIYVYIYMSVCIGYQELLKEGLNPNKLTYNAVAGACSRLGKAKEVLFPLKF